MRVGGSCGGGLIATLEIRLREKKKELRTERIRAESKRPAEM